MQNADLVRKDPMARSPRAVQADAIRRAGVPSGRRRPRQIRRPQVSRSWSCDQPRLRGSSNFLVFIEEPDRHACGQSQRQSSRVPRDTREPGPGKGSGIDIDAGARAKSSMCPASLYPSQNSFLGPGIRPWPLVENHPVSQDDPSVLADRGLIDLSITRFLSTCPFWHYIEFALLA